MSNSTVNGGITNSETVETTESGRPAISIGSSIDGDMTSSGQFVAPNGHGIVVTHSSGIVKGIANSRSINAENGLTLGNATVEGEIINESGGIIKSSIGFYGVCVDFGSMVDRGITNSGLAKHSAAKSGNHVSQRGKRVPPLFSKPLENTLKCRLRVSLTPGESTVQKSSPSNH